MSSKQAPTAKQKAERARRFQMGIALVRSPLKHIKARAKDEYQNARYAADRGNGALVQRIARSI